MSAGCTPASAGMAKPRRATKAKIDRHEDITHLRNRAGWMDCAQPIIKPMLRIVLVEPREAGNVGAAARVMKNFGFRELWIVGQHPPLQPLAGWWASGADDVVASARFAPTLHAAIADTQVAIATTSARGRTTPVDLSPSELSETFAALRDD